MRLRDGIPGTSRCIDKAPGALAPGHAVIGHDEDRRFVLRRQKPLWAGTPLGREVDAPGTKEYNTAVARFFDRHLGIRGFIA
jgi:hypothetical protein